MSKGKVVNVLDEEPIQGVAIRVDGSIVTRHRTLLHQAGPLSMVSYTEDEDPTSNDIDIQTDVGYLDDSLVRVKYKGCTCRVFKMERDKTTWLFLQTDYNMLPTIKSNIKTKVFKKEPIAINISGNSLLTLLNFKKEQFEDREGNTFYIRACSEPHLGIRAVIMQDSHGSYHTALVGPYSARVITVILP